ncbi:MAG: hypothetical protein GWN18_08385 [Thermoplasmata archaeon]|nr:hypothetical protein [Thermoplasmata archaeon]NIS12062.1 hypothetical protein [Thermoplasmata archaeon]NIS19986.1 hypothetical protein [Thermoplasmata archaeon]NIT77181.1 hypothetical protein [Thermoplasmata archaeon]NIU49093.1 hypothetical protein [Thermoplasmata archaeon]
MEDRAEIEARIRELVGRKEELEASIPAHSTKPHHIMQIEKIEEEIELLEERLQGLG